MRSKSTHQLVLTPPGGARGSTDEGSQRGTVGDSIHSKIEATASPSQGSQLKETHIPQTRLPANRHMSPGMTHLFQPMGTAIHQAMKPRILASTGSAQDSAETNEARHTVKMISELKRYFREHERSLNVKNMLLELSGDLRKFITGSDDMHVPGPIKRKP